jgi:hypothetical protein
VKKFCMVLGMFALAAAPVQAQQGQPRREELEAAIVQRFLDRAATELKLDGNTRTRAASASERTTTSQSRAKHRASAGRDVARGS